MKENPVLLLQKAKSKIALLLWLWSEKSVSPWLFQRKRLEKYEPKQPAFPLRKWAYTVNEDGQVGLPLFFFFPFFYFLLQMKNANTIWIKHKNLLFSFGEPVLFSFGLGFWVFCWFAGFFPHLKGYFDKGSVCKLSFLLKSNTDLPLFLKVMSSIAQI